MRQFIAVELADTVSGVLTGNRDKLFSLIAIDIRFVSSSGQSAFFRISERINFKIICDA